MGDGIDGVRSERQFRLKDRLSLKTGSLTHEEMIEIAGDRVLVDVKDFLAQMDRHRTV